MKQHLKSVFIPLYVLLLAGCGGVLNMRTYDFKPPPLKPFIDQAIWSNATKDKAYTACLTALHMRGFNIHPMGTSKESGLIIVGSVDVSGDSSIVKCSYSMQILVSEVPNNKVMVNVNPRGFYKPINLPSDFLYNKSYELSLKNTLNNRIATDMEKFFAQMDTLLGKAESHRGGIILKWK